ncbi:MAG: alkaline phosphatase family protein [Clostridia bacterium]|nr:alkaline phosphatase family protein [Clostridia bacterium]
MKLVLHKIVIWIVTTVLMTAGSLFGTNHWDTPEKYMARIDAIQSMFENTPETAVPQTRVYSLICDHFRSPLPAGKTEKKAIVIGYDGCRADMLGFAKDPQQSAILTLGKEGHTVFSYCGGVNYPYVNTQATSTAPGWCSMLTGAWADVHGIRRNYQPKSNDHLTMLTTLVQDGTIDNSAFYVSWPGHLNGRLTTYYPEKQYVQEQGLPVTFLQAEDDDGTFSNIMNDLAQKDCTDFIFFTFEYTDHVGHTSGFDPKNPKYEQAFYDAEAHGKMVIEQIQARDTYETEDWLILITTDHGGYDLNHGRCTIHERTTFMVCNKPILGE